MPQTPNQVQVSGFRPTPSYVSMSVSGSTSNAALPVGSTVIVYNTGSNTAFIKFGSSGVIATTADEVVPAGSWMAFSPGAGTTLAAITGSSTTTLTLSGGTGLPIGGVGGSSSGGGGAVTAVSGAFVDGSIATIGTEADTAWVGSGSGTLVAILKALYNAIIGTLTFVNSNPATIYSGQQTLTASAVVLPTKTLVNGIIISALPANTGTVYVGPSGVTTSTGYPLTAGQSISFAVTNLNAIYIIGTNTTDKVAFTGN